MSTQAAGTSSNVNTGEIRAMNDANHAQQLELMKIQADVTLKNTLTTAISAMQKGNDDVLRALANNLK